MKRSIEPPMIFRVIAIVSIAILVAFVPLRDANALEFRVADNQLILSGEVLLGDYSRFKWKLSEQIDTVVVKNCLGGSTLDGYDIAELIRERGLRTVVAGRASSACAHIFMGGKERHFAKDSSERWGWIGLHGNFSKVPFMPDPLMQTRSRKFYVEYSGGKMDGDLFDRAFMIPSAAGHLRFYHPAEANRKDGVTVFLCQSMVHVNECEKLPTVNALQQGVVTSWEMIKVDEKAAQSKKSDAEKMDAGDAQRRSTGDGKATTND